MRWSWPPPALPAGTSVLLLRTRAAMADRGTPSSYRVWLSICMAISSSGTPRNSTWSIPRARRSRSISRATGTNSSMVPSPEMSIAAIVSSHRLRLTNGGSMSVGRSRTWDMRCLIRSMASIMSVPLSKRILISATPSKVLDLRLCILFSERSWYSTGWVTSRSTSSALAPGQTIVTLAPLESWVGLSCTVSWRRPQRPARINMIINRLEARRCRVKVSIR